MSTENPETLDEFDLRRDEQVTRIVEEHGAEFGNARPLLEALLKLAYTIGCTDTLQQRSDLIKLNQMWTLPETKEVGARRI